MSSSRKIHNFESKILIQETIDEYGYSPDCFGPTSKKFVIAICGFCGKNHKISIGSFNRAGSACHNECKLEEQKINSPMKNKATREKAKRAIEEKYGKNRAEIGRKISAAKNTKESKQKTETTNLERYGVKSVFQNQEIKEKIKQTNLEKYGAEHPQKSQEIRNRTKQTNIERYGVDNVFKNKNIKEQIKQTNIERYGVEHPQKSQEIKEATKQTNLEKYGVEYCFLNYDVRERKINSLINKYNIPEDFNLHTIVKIPMIKEEIRNAFVKAFDLDESKKFHLSNTLRNNDEFWKDLDGNNLKSIAEKYDFDYGSLTSALHRDEFKDRYLKTYNFPINQVHKDLYNIIKELLPDTKIILNDKKAISPLELDIYIPEKNFAIEFNGSYWHSEAILSQKESRNKHYNKTKLCREKGIRLFHIFEHSWKEKKNQILNFIKTIIGCNKITIGARKCTLKLENINESNIKFMNDNHIQGATYCLKYFNLYYNEELVASMTASRHHRQGNNDKCVVLSRLCFKDGYNVQGGASRLFKAFKQWAIENGYEKIISWSDNTFTDGKIYEVLNFKLEENLPVDYFYWNPKEDRYVSKQSQKKKTTNCPAHLTEREWCLERGLYRIYDSGKKRWVYELEMDNING